ncbi:MAG: PadR family transcriptional regulator [Chloroflexota bacterium]
MDIVVLVVIHSDIPKGKAMGDRDSDYSLHDAERRAEEAREAWKRAKEEMKAAFKQAKEERRRAQGATETQRDEIDETMEEVAESAREFAREVSDEARRLAQDLWHGARHEWHGRWREQWEKSMGKDWQDHWVFGGRRFRQWGAGGEETNPFVAAILSRGAGLLALYVLQLLKEQPRHGNDIMRQIEQRTMGSWASNPGAIYPLLSSMEENGLVRSGWEDPDKRTRRVYQLTDEGMRELERLRRVLRPRVMEAIEVLHVLYDDLYGEDAGTPSGGAGERTESTPTSTTPGTGVDPDVPPEPDTTAHVTAEAEEAMAEAERRAARWRERFGRLFGRGAAPAAYGA